MEKLTVLTNLWFKFKITVLCAFLNQNTTEVALLHSKRNQVKVASGVAAYVAAPGFR